MKKETIIRSFKKTVISIKIGEENNQIYILSKFTDDLPIPNDINISDINKNDEYELFKRSKYNDT